MGPISRGGRFALAVMAAVAVFLISAQRAWAAPTPDQALAELNTWRGEIGEPLLTTPTNVVLNAGCAAHDSYETLTGTFTHEEDSHNSHYTTAGAQAGYDSVLAELGGGPTAAELPGPIWDPGVFHRAALLAPRLAVTGFDSSGGFECMWAQNLNVLGPDPVQVMDDARRTAVLSLYPSPANGAYGVPTTFADNESPDPTTEAGLPAGSPLGWLLNVEINGPWDQVGDAYAHDVTASLTPDGTTAHVPLFISQCGSSGCVGGGGTLYGALFSGGFGIYPTAPLAANTTYRVVVNGTVTDSQAHIDYPITNYSWCFSTGATYTVSSDCAAPTTAAQEVSTPNASTAASFTPMPPAPSSPGLTPPATTTAPTTTTAPGDTTSPGKSTPPGVGTRPASTDRPPVTDATVSGLSGRHPRLTVDVHAVAGAPGIHRIAVTPPHGMSFSGRTAALRHVRVAIHGQKTRWHLSVRHGVLAVTLTRPRRRVAVCITGEALRVSRTLAHAHGRLSVRVATTAGGRTTTRRLRLTAR